MWGCSRAKSRYNLRGLDASSELECEAPEVRLRGALSRAQAEQGLIPSRARVLGTHPEVVKLMFGRDVLGEPQQRDLLQPRLADLRKPDAMAGFEPAVELLVSAYKHGFRVGVFGDYDVDGVTTTTILTTFLEALGIEIVARVASRESGYGFGVEDAKALVQAGAKIVLTGDCGTSDHEALAWLRERGVPTAVIDHHQVPDEMPPTDALLNPHQPGCEFPFKGLCSAGVAFYLCASVRTALAREVGRERLPDPRSWLDLVAMGTVCDMVPMVAENRILVRHGLRVVAQRRRPGVRALLDSSGVGRDEPIDESHLGFRLGPRLNAPGRLGAAAPSLSLLRARGNSEAKAMAARVEMLNTRRRDHQDTIVQEALALLAQDPQAGKRHGIVIGREGWLHGIVGIAANGIVEAYRRPALVLAIDSQRGIARGSVRTFGDVDVRAALHDCRELLTRYGGHQAAAGLTMDIAQVPALTEAFDQAVARQTSDQDGTFLEPCDGQLSIAEVTDDLMDALESLGPYGIGFPAPRYLIEEAEVVRERILRGKHLSLVLRQGRAHIDAIAFNQAPDLKINDKVGCLFVPMRSHFRNRRRIQLQIERLWRVPG